MHSKSSLKLAWASIAEIGEALGTRRFTAEEIITVSLPPLFVAIVYAHIARSSIRGSRMSTQKCVPSLWSTRMLSKSPEGVIEGGKQVKLEVCLRVSPL
jgi:hypothetical protein